MGNKIIDSHLEISRIAKALKTENKTIVFTNGCFDILHAGHVSYLTEAKNEGDVLILGLNSDQSVKTIKGDKRPVIKETHRAEVLAGLACIDYIVLFDEPDPGTLIQKILPDVLVKGADWSEKDIIGADVVKNAGGRVARIRLEPDISTTLIIKKIVNTYCHENSSI